VDFIHLAISLFYKVVVERRLKKYIIFLLWYACATPTQNIEIADLWETDEVFDCLQYGMCSSFEDPENSEWGDEALVSDLSFPTVCPSHQRVMVDDTKTETTVKVSKR